MSRSGAPQARGAEQLLVIVVMALVAFGVVMVYSASASLALLEHHAVYAGIGLAALWLLARHDYRHMASLAPTMLVISGVLLVLVVASGVERNGAQRWLSLPGGFTLQPSELAKVALCVFAAAALSARRQPPRDWREAMRPVGAAAAILCGLIVISDLGSAIAVGLAAAAVLIASGAAAGALARLGHGGSGARGRDDRRRAVPHAAPDRVPAPGRHARRRRATSCTRLSSRSAPAACWASASARA